MVVGTDLMKYRGQIAICHICNQLEDECHFVLSVILTIKIKTNMIIFVEILSGQNKTFVIYQLYVCTSFKLSHGFFYQI